MSVHRRGDNIPPISAYAHWNEDAELMWYQENRYDMEYADEIIEDEDDRYEYEPDPLVREFERKEDAEEFFAIVEDGTMFEWPKGRWNVEYYHLKDKEAAEKYWGITDECDDCGMKNGAHNYNVEH